MIKVITFIVTKPDKVPGNKLLQIEYPELQKYFAKGFQIVESLPAWGNGNDYFVTFILGKERSSRKRSRE